MPSTDGNGIAFSPPLRFHEEVASGDVAVVKHLPDDVGCDSFGESERERARERGRMGSTRVLAEDIFECYQWRE